MGFIYLIRTAFASLFSFELLNSIKVLNFPLNFPWTASVLLSSLVWLFWEKFVKKKVDFPMFIGGLFLFQLYANTFGNVLRFYAKFDWYDRFTHFTGGAVVGATLFLALIYLNKKRGWGLTLKFLAIFAISLALSFCVLWELLEYFIDFSLGYNVIQDEYDTTSDLVFDLIGATVAVLFIVPILKKTIRGLTTS